MGKRRTNPNDIAVALVEGLDVLVLEARNADECHPELRELASDRPRIASERVDGGDAVDKNGQNKGGQICRRVHKECAEEGALSEIGHKGEEEWGREKNRGMETDVVRLVLAKHLMRCLPFRGLRSVREDTKDAD